MVKPVVRGSPQPYGLTVFRGAVYWADWKTGTIERADKDTGESDCCAAQEAEHLKYELTQPLAH